ncbi:MAG: hypothetical protein K2N94_16590, partial [Lachnospiraceae bacterium]|nr:hypothetical protein [Lachnospiraceae bacterium]
MDSETKKDMEQSMTRWRLILGQDSQNRFGQMGGAGLSGELDMMDQALAAIYNLNSPGSFGSQGGGTSAGAGKGPSNPQITKWLGDVRSLFDPELVKIIQGDAMTRCGLKQLIFEPELLENLEPEVNLASTILLLKDQIPKRSKESVRAFIQKIVEEINKLLEQDIRRAVTAAVNKHKHSPIPSAAALDYKTTISRNLKHYNQDLKTIVPEHFYFFDRTSTTAANKWNIILDIDQ